MSAGGALQSDRMADVTNMSDAAASAGTRPSDPPIERPTERRAVREPDAARFSAIEAAYGRVAPLYDLVFGKLLEPGRRALGQWVASCRPDTLLDVGVGSGLTLRWYPPRTRVVGIDLSDEMLARARRRAAAMPDRTIDLRRMNAERMEFADASFDCVAVPYTLSVTPDTPRLVAELRRVCRPGGTILIVNHFSGGRLWHVVERAARPLATRLGVKPSFGFADNILAHDWQVVRAEPVNAFGLSTLVEIRNAGGQTRAGYAKSIE